MSKNISAFERPTMNLRDARIKAIVFFAVALLLCTSKVAAQITETSTEADQRELSVTVYNSNVGLVRDVRKLTLPKGKIDLNFAGVAKDIQPSTVHIVSLTSPKQFSVLEQDYQYNLLSPQTLLKQYVGKRLTFVRKVAENNSTKEVPVEATLLADNDGLVWKIGNQIVTGMPADHYIFPSLPTNLYSHPTLVWRVDNAVAGGQTLEVDYLTNSMNWTADYILTLAEQNKAADLNGWVSVTNNSGATFRNVRLQLVAGQLHQVTPMPRPLYQRMGGTIGALAAPEVAQEPVSEYHLYTIGRRTTLPNNDTKQIELLAASGIKVDKTYEVNGQSFYYSAPLAGGQPVKEPVQARVKFKNSEANSLGMPVPAGTVRVYQPDSKGHLQWIGEDRIAATAKDETLNLDIGNAFDLVAERKQTDFQSLGQHVYEAAFDVTLRNHKTEPVTVEVNEPIGGEWTILKSNYKYQKTSAFSARFSVPVPANGESVLSYRVRVRI
jgi:hypothetical protein